MSEWGRKLEEIRDWTDKNISQPLTIDRSPGWSGRMAHGAVQTAKGAGAGLAEAGRIVGGALDEHVAEPIQRELYEGEAAYRKLNETPTHQVSKDFGKDYLQKNISNMFGEDGSLKIKEGLAGNYMAAEQEAEAEKAKARGKVDKAATDTSQPTGPVNDPNVKAVAEKVAAVTAGKNPDEVSKAVDEAKTASETNPDEGDLYAKAIDKTSQDMHNSNITPDNWYESDAFRLGLIRFGLGLMSGEDYATAFSHAAGDYTVLSDRQKRESYTDELLADGYREADIIEWISKGDASVLKLPDPTYSQVTEKDGSIWEINDRTKKKTQLRAPTTPKDMRGLIVQEGDRQLLVNPYTGNTIKEYGVKPRGSGSGSGVGAGGADQSKNPFRSNAQVYMGAGGMRAAMTNWQRMVEDEGGIGNYGMADLTGSASNVLGTGTMSGRFLQELSPGTRKAKEAEESFLQAYGRVLSGGAIKDEEWYSWGNTFFPRNGDTERDLLRKQFMRDNIGLLVENMYYSTGIDPKTLSTEERAAYARDMSISIQNEAGRVFQDVVDYIPPQGNMPGAYALKDGSFWSPEVGYIRPGGN